MSNNLKAIIKRTAIYAVLLLVYVGILAAFGMHCPIADLIGVKCPTCGVSRALISLFVLDFKASYNYQPLALPLVISVWILLNAQYFKHKTPLQAVAITTLVLNFILYIINLAL